jgi:hypothetical protein
MPGANAAAGGRGTGYGVGADRCPMEIKRTPAVIGITRAAADDEVVGEGARGLFAEPGRARPVRNASTAALPPRKQKASIFAH